MRTRCGKGYRDKCSYNITPRQPVFQSHCFIGWIGREGRILRLLAALDTGTIHGPVSCTKSRGAQPPCRCLVELSTKSATGKQARTTHGHMDHFGLLSIRRFGAIVLAGEHLPRAE